MTECPAERHSAASTELKTNVFGDQAGGLISIASQVAASEVAL
jgi:hypothetical protein